MTDVRVREGRIDPWPAEALAATLSLDGAPGHGDPLPTFWHQLYLLDAPPRSALGPDGHERRGRFLPDVPGRRMYAGGSLRLVRPVVVGTDVTRESEVTAVVEKLGRSGPLTFVTVEHRFSDKDGPLLVEEQHLVYREGSLPPSRPEATMEPDAAPDLEETLVPDEVLLFRFSALTFNGHRIHYDRGYATEVEGYPDLVVHGPLIALLLAGIAERLGGQPTAFGFRARSPLFVGRSIRLRGRRDGRHAVLAAIDDDGRTAMTAEATFR